MVQVLEINTQALERMTSEELNTRLAEIAFNNVLAKNYAQAQERYTILRILRSRGLR